MKHVAKRKLPKNVLSDETIRLTGVRTSKSYPQPLRRIRAKKKRRSKRRSRCPGSEPNVGKSR